MSEKFELVEKIQEREILEAQQKWGSYIIKIASLYEKYKSRTVCGLQAEIFLKDLYAFDLGLVLFKPTRASNIQFRLTEEAAKAYFVGGNEKYPEDSGFALYPWKKINFENAGFIIENSSALVMGNYYLTEENGKISKIEYTFGYTRAINQNNKLKINLHHSSFPYMPQVST